MESQKKQREAFRVAQHAGPHPALSAAAGAAASKAQGVTASGSQAAAFAAGSDAQLVPDTQRVILHFDVDSFYAQARCFASETFE